MYRIFSFINKQILYNKIIVKKPIHPTYPKPEECCKESCSNYVFTQFLQKEYEYVKRMKIYNKYQNEYKK